MFILSSLNAYIACLVVQHFKMCDFADRMIALQVLKKGDEKVIKIMRSSSGRKVNITNHFSLEGANFLPLTFTNNFKGKKLYRMRCVWRLVAIKHFLCLCMSWNCLNIS